MNTFAFPSQISLDSTGSFTHLKRRFGPLASVLALHVVLYYGISSGMVSQVVAAAMPRTVYVEFVAPTETAPTPEPVIPKTVQLTPPPLVVPPIVPVVIQTPNPNAISIPQPQPAPLEKTAAPAVVAVAAPAAAPAPAPSAPRTITSGVEYIQAPQLKYPNVSKRLGEQGQVLLRVLIDEKGNPSQVVVQTSSGFARLDEAGRQAVLRAQFKPNIEDGRPVPAYVVVPLNFALTS